MQADLADELAAISRRLDAIDGMLLALIRLRLRELVAAGETDAVMELERELYAIGVEPRTRAAARRFGS